MLYAVKRDAVAFKIKSKVNINNANYNRMQKILKLENIIQILKYIVEKHNI